MSRHPCKSLSVSSKARGRVRVPIRAQSREVPLFNGSQTPGRDAHHEHRPRNDCGEVNSKKPAIRRSRVKPPIACRGKRQPGLSDQTAPFLVTARSPENVPSQNKPPRLHGQCSRRRTGRELFFRDRRRPQYSRPGRKEVEVALQACVGVRNIISSQSPRSSLRHYRTMNLNGFCRDPERYRGCFHAGIITV